MNILSLLTLALVLSSLTACGQKESAPPEFDKKIYRQEFDFCMQHRSADVKACNEYASKLSSYD